MQLQLQIHWAVGGQTLTKVTRRQDFDEKRSIKLTFSISKTRYPAKSYKIIIFPVLGRFFLQWEIELTLYECKRTMVVKSAKFNDRRQWKYSWLPNWGNDFLEVDFQKIFLDFELKLRHRAFDWAQKGQIPTNSDWEKYFEQE